MKFRNISSKHELEKPDLKKMRIKFAVIGDPIAHTLSPAMQNAGLKALGLEADYFAVHVVNSELGAFAERARKELAGFNITVPHKNAIIPFLDSISRESRIAGSVNTVTVKDGKLIGDTTDGYGMEQALREAFRYEVPGGTIAFAGCGGAAHAVSVWFAARGAKKLYFMNRTVKTAEILAEQIEKEYRIPCEVCGTDDPDSIRRFLKDSDILLQCTSLGLKPEDPPPFDLALLPEKIRVYDTIYKQTPICRECARRGIPFANGLGMLLHQGARSMEIWTGRKAPVEIMRAALENAFQEKSAGKKEN